MRHLLAFLLLAAAAAWLAVVVGHDYRQKQGAQTAEAAADMPLGNPPPVGDPAPDFTLVEAHDAANPEHVTLSKVTADGPVLVIFYLSYQCERCVTHLKEIAGNIDQFDKAGLQVIAISPDTPEVTRDALKEFGDIPLTLLSDPDGKVAKKYGLLAAGDEQLHGAFVVGRDGRIRFEQVGEEPMRDWGRALEIARNLQAGGK